jgi:beta-lactamase superfamily II metal-dependent hydrolase
VAGLRYSYVLVFDIGVITFILVLSMQYIIQFMVGSKVLKGVVLSIFALSIVLSLIFDFMPKTYSQNQIISFNQYYGNMVVMTNNEDVTIVGYNYRDYDRLSTLLKQHKINKIENVVLYDLESNTENLNSFIFDYKVKHLYMPKNFKIDENIDVTIHIVESQFTLGTTTCSYVENDNVVGVAINCNNAITIVGNNFKRSEWDHIGDIYRKGVKRIIVNKVEYDYSQFVDCEEIISQSNNNYYSNIVLDNEKLCYSYI